MNKLRNLLVTVIAITSLTSASFAGNFGIGVSGSLAMVKASGTESDRDGTADTSIRAAEVDNNVFAGEIFAEYTTDYFNGMTIGASWVPGTADVSSSVLNRTDSGSTDSTDDNIDRTAQAEVENITTYYAELPLMDALYLKAGFVQMDVNTLEKLKSGVAYNNNSVDGTMLGLGVKADIGSNMYYKVEGTMTNMEQATFTDNNTVKGNQVKADLDVNKLTIALGYKF